MKKFKQDKEVCLFLFLFFLVFFREVFKVSVIYLFARHFSTGGQSKKLLSVKRASTWAQICPKP